MSFCPLLLGDDLSGRKIYVNPQGQYEVTQLKIIARASNTNYLVESVSGGTVFGRCHYKNSMNEIATITFYRQGSGYLESFDLPDDFGVLYEVNEDAVLYPMLKRIANEKRFVFTEDMSREEV